MSNDLFPIEETKPTRLQQARRALADAERELAIAEDAAENFDGFSIAPEYQRAVDRFTELVKAEEEHALKLAKSQ